MRVIVTGGAGYIGSFAVERLIEAGHDVTVLDSLWRGHRGGVSDAAQLIAVDITDAKATRDVVAKVRPDAILHYAAAAIVPESVADPGLYFEVNVVGSHNLIRAALAADCHKFVLSSTAAIYGIPDVSPIREDLPPNPINPYGLSKLMVEQMLEWYAKSIGLNYAAMRYFNVAGATTTRGEDHRPETHVIPVMLETLLGRRKHFTIFGNDYPTPDGTAIRDYVHVLDLADAHVLALGKLDKSLGAFNLGSKGGFSVRELVTAVEEVTGKTLPVEIGPRRPGDPPILVADSSRARTELGWNPSRSTLDQMISSAWEWMQSRPDGYN